MGLSGQAIAKIQNYRQQSASLLLYQSVLAGEPGQAFLALLAALEVSDSLICCQAYGRWFSAIAQLPHGWRDYLIYQLLTADNAFSQQAQRLSEQQVAAPLSESFPPGMIAAVNYDLAIIHSLYHLPVNQLSQWVQQKCDGAAPPVMHPLHEPKLPVQFPYEPEWTAAVGELTAYYRAHGVGLWGEFMALRPAADGSLEGIARPDPIRLDQLIGYDPPKQQLVQNTEALMRGYMAQNVLLYGSRGAGKSSLVKALLNEYCDRGLRLIEVPKPRLQLLPKILAPLADLPQKFIIFVDDLSFEEDDEAFKALKVVLEGGVTARPQNVVVYATSNRRHLIREFFDERPRPKDADEIQAWDTVQEKLSFSDRFGLTLTFTPADQPTYLTIVRELVAQAGLSLDADHLDWRARQWATRHNGRSGRSARQFVDFLIAEQGNPQG